MTIHVVHKQIGGYAREDAPNTLIVGAYTDQRFAELVALTVGATITTVTVDELAPGHKSMMRALGYDLEVRESVDPRVLECESYKDDEG